MEHSHRERDQGQDTLQIAASLKMFMMKSCTKGRLNLYDHITRLLIKVMDEHPDNAVEVIEDMSRDVKRSLYEDKQNTMQELPQTTAAEELAKQQCQLFQHLEEPDHEEELMESPLHNLSETGFYLEQVGVGLGRMEMQRIFLALKQLAQSEQLLRCRLWGKILGRESNYIIVEAEHKGEEKEEEQRSEETSEEGEKEVEAQDNKNEMELLPQWTYKPPPVVPKEDIGTGANKFMYYVCKEPGLPWVKLPSVSPAQITAARQIRKFFIGRLDAPVFSYPPFPGNEGNYLRAQIARISAGTHVSPKGFFQAKEEESDEVTLDSYEVNPDFEGIPVSEMAVSLSSWVHHVQHILPQGRCSWVNLAVNPTEDSNEEGETVDMEGDPDEPEPEVGPPLLTPLSQDTEIFNTPPWSLKLSSTLTPDHSVAMLRSNVWPGAHAYACGRKFENIYIGWGLKYAGEGYSPPLLPLPQEEYPSGPEITEALDPTVEEEVELKAALQEQQVAHEEMGDSEKDEDEDEEDDD